MSNKTNKYINRISRLEARNEKLANFDTGLVKVAFDTRKVNQFTDYNPRRNLQHFNRSEDYLTIATATRLNSLNRIKIAIDELERNFCTEPEWLDSYTRVLKDALDKALRISQASSDYSEKEIDYLEELIDMRYRVRLAEVVNMSIEDIKTKVLAKDQSLLHKYSFYKNDIVYKKSGEDTSSNTKQTVQGSSNPININVINNMAGQNQPGLLTTSNDSPQMTNIQPNNDLKEMSLRLERLENLLSKLI